VGYTQDAAAFAGVVADAGAAVADCAPGWGGAGQSLNCYHYHCGRAARCLGQCAGDAYASRALHTQSHTAAVVAVAGAG
jgi:hypothetical protein